MKLFNPKNRKRVVGDYVIEDSDKLLECFMVPEDNPLLTGILCTARATGEGAREQASTPAMPADERAFHAGGMKYMRDYEDEILKLVEQANRVSNR